jgi:hypothetical protein
MDELDLFRGDTVLLKGRRKRVTVLIAFKKKKLTCHFRSVSS